MPKIYNNKFSLAFDIYGCPNRCKHCWIGFPKHSKMNPDEVFDAFSKIKNEQENLSYYDSELEFIDISFREPHYGDDYKSLYERMDKINGCKLEVAKNYELISLWRLVNDGDYLPWIKERGIRKAQLKVFGMRETNNFFYGRKGAHAELINGTNILIDNGIIPRWQIYLNKMGIDELSEVKHLAYSLDLFAKVKNLGENFSLRGFPYDSSGAGLKNHCYRIDEDDIDKCPVDIVDISSLRVEKDLINDSMTNPNISIAPKSHNLWFFITANWDVYPNFNGINPWWKLGNLKSDKWERILERYINNDTFGLKMMVEKPLRELVIECGEPDSRKVFTMGSQYGEYLLEKYCAMKFA